MRSGPEVVDFPEGDEVIDLDSEPPIVIDRITRGTDFGVDVSDPAIGTLNGEDGPAPLPPSDKEPSEAECLEAMWINPTYNLELTKGSRYRAVSRDGRTARLRAVAVPAEGTIRLEATVREMAGTGAAEGEQGADQSWE